MRIIGYIAFGVLMLAVALYVRFPGDAVRDYLIARTDEACPGASLSLGAVKPALPVGLALQDVAFRSRENPSKALAADEIIIRPSIVSLFGGKTSILLRGAGFGGRANAIFNFSRAFSTAGPMKAEMRLENIDTRNLSVLHEFLARQITGRLDASLTFNGQPEKIIEGSGRLKFFLANGTYPLREAVVGIEKIDFTSIEGDVQLSDGTLKIGRLTLAGEKVNYSLKGKITLNSENLGLSPLDMTGSVEIRGANKKIPLALTGTLGKPVTQLM